MRFTGNIDAKTDAKGRLFLPATFRRILQEESEERLILRRDVFQSCLVLYPESVWNKQVDALAERAGMFDRRGRDMLRRFVADSETVTLDANGRFLVPKRYLAMAGIQNEVRFIGVDNTIEVWALDAAQRMLAENETLGDDLEAFMNEQP
ncbi:MAG: division/cell wall cluster transcriptional repressor MraZ [Paraprevotella sp.]|nr:division/cell wall cluster transcriptional repressor MraZ [Paraprevotella sp.]